MNKEIEKFLLDQDALKVGFATRDSLAGGPPSVDLTYLLPEAQSAVCFAFQLDKEKIHPFFRKDLPNGRNDHENDNLDLYTKIYKISITAVKFIENKGYKAVSIIPNFHYRTELEGWHIKPLPKISLRYLAVRSGIGSFGWSGNVGMKDIGTTILLGGLVTSAELTPTDPLPESESFCTKCKLCVKVCAFRMFDDKEKETVNMGGYTFNYAKRVDVTLCDIICGGFSGLDRSEKWSTWSPGRFPHPETDAKALQTLASTINKSFNWQKSEDPGEEYIARIKKNTNVGNINAITTDPDKFITVSALTCGNCQLLCWGNEKDTQENYHLLTNSGCVIQKEDGKIAILPADDAKKVFEDMDPKHKELYSR